MQIKKFLDKVCSEIKYKSIRNEIYEELESHIEEIKQEYTMIGKSNQEIEDKVIEQMGDPIQIGKELNKIHHPKFDFELLFLVMILISFGMLVAFTRAKNLGSDMVAVDSIHNFILYVFIGATLGGIIYFIDYNKILKYSSYIYLLATFIILATFFSGFNINGVRHISLGIANFTPDVISLPLYIIAYVGFLQEDDKRKAIIKILIACAISIILLISLNLILSAIILASVCLTIVIINIYNSNKGKMCYLLSLIVLVTFLLILFSTYCYQYNINKIESVNLQTEAQIIIKNAKIFGKSEFAKTGLEIFDKSTNYTLLSALANYGWIVSIGMMIFVTLFDIKIITNTFKIKDKYGKFLIIGIANMFIIQTLLHILVNFGVKMNSNIYLPLISWGGINLIVNICLVSLLFSIYRKKDVFINKKKIFVGN